MTNYDIRIKGDRAIREMEKAQEKAQERKGTRKGTRNRTVLRLRSGSAGPECPSRRSGIGVKKASGLPHSYATASRSYRPAQTSEPGFTLHKLRHDDFHAVCGLREEYRTPVPDADGPMVGKSVTAPDGWSGKVTGYAVDTETKKVTAFVRVNGRLYRESVLQLA